MIHRLFKLEREAEQRVHEARDREIDPGGPGSARRASEAMDAPMLEVAKIRKMRQRLGDKQMEINHQSNLLRKTRRNPRLRSDVKSHRTDQVETKLAGLTVDFKALEAEAEQRFFPVAESSAESLNVSQDGVTTPALLSRESRGTKQPVLPATPNQKPEATPNNPLPESNRSEGISLHPEPDENSNTSGDATARQVSKPPVAPAQEGALRRETDQGPLQEESGAPNENTLAPLEASKVKGLNAEDLFGIKLRELRRQISENSDLTAMERSQLNLLTQRTNSDKQPVRKWQSALETITGRRDELVKTLDSQVDARTDVFDEPLSKLDAVIGGLTQRRDEAMERDRRKFVFDAGEPKDDFVPKGELFKKLEYDSLGIGQIEYGLRNLGEGVRAKSLGDEALEARNAEAAKGTFEPGTDEADAYKHVYWSYRMTQDLGAATAKGVGDAHEVSGRHGDGERLKDLYNNNVGRGLALDPANAGRDAATVIREAMKLGLVQMKPFEVKEDQPRPISDDEMRSGP